MVFAHLTFKFDRLSREGEINAVLRKSIEDRPIYEGAVPQIGINPLSPPSAPVQGRLQGPPAKSKFLAEKFL
jgi:hypothetical protein